MENKKEHHSNHGRTQIKSVTKFNQSRPLVRPTFKFPNSHQKSKKRC